MGIFSGWFNRALNLTAQDRQTIWRLFGSFDANKFAMKGNSAIQNSYEKNLDVYSVIKKIVDTTKALPWIIEEKSYNGAGEWKEKKDSSLHALLEKPNVTKGYTFNDLEEQILIYLLCTGNAYLFGESTFLDNQIAEIDVLPSEAVCIESNDDFFLPVVKYRFNLGRNQRVFEKERIQHIKFFNPAYQSVTESLYGLSIVQVAARAIQVGNSRMDAMAATYDNRGAFGLITDKSQRPMTTTEASQAQEALDERIAGVSKYGKTIMTNKDLNYIQLAMSPADLQLIESGVVTLRSICSVFGLDSSLFNDPANKTFNNRLEAEKALYTNAVMPLSDKLSEHFTNFLCTSHFPDKKVRMRQDFSKVECLQENFKDKATILVSLKREGIYTANEVREKLGDKKSLDENADKLIISTTLVENIGNNEANTGADQGAQGSQGQGA